MAHLIHLPGSFTRRERELFCAWLDRIEEIYQDEGQPLDYCGDGLPVLACLIFQKCPKAKPETRKKLFCKLSMFFEESRRVADARPVGRA